MAKYRIVRTDFWIHPVVSEEMTPEDKYFFLYLLTNPHTTQIGIYKITKKQMAFDTGYSIESIHSLMNRMEHHHQVIRYNQETREIAIKNWGKYNLNKGGKPVIDCILSELKEVEDTLLITYVADNINKNEILAIYESFCEKEDDYFGKEVVESADERLESDQLFDDTVTNRHTSGVQKEKENEKEKEQNTLYTTIEENPEGEGPVQITKKEEVKEIIEFWDQNGFGYNNVNAKEQLLDWLEYSRFLNPKDVILKAMQIACSNNKRRLNYVVGILKNWDNESLLTIEEIDGYNEKKKLKLDQGVSVEELTRGRDIPKEFELNLTAGEDW